METQEIVPTSLLLVSTPENWSTRNFCGSSWPRHNFAVLWAAFAPDGHLAICVSNTEDSKKYKKIRLPFQPMFHHLLSFFFSYVFLITSEVAASPPPAAMAP
jgi:hypothetical protein